MPEESVVELSLRPQRLSEFIGQDRVKESLRIYIDAALARREPLDHTLFFGPPGLGKTTLAELIARELGVNIRTTSGPALEKPGDLVGTLTNLRKVANATQQPVGDARSSARSLGDLLRAVLVDVDLHHLGSAVDDLLEVPGGIEIEPHLDPEPRAHGRSEHAEPSGRADQGELLDLHGDRLRLGSFGEADFDLVILHRGIEELFDDGPEAVDLVDEEDVAFSQIGERSD